MFKLRNVTIRPKLMTLLLIIGLIPMITTGWFATRIADDSLKDRAFKQLETILYSKKLRMEAYIIERFADLKTMAREETVLEAMEHFQKVFQDVLSMKQEVGDQKWEQKVEAGFVQQMGRYKDNSGYYDIIFISKDGNVVYTVAREEDLGKNVAEGSLKNSALHKLFIKIQTGKAMQDFEPYGPSGFRHASFLGMKLEKDSKNIGVIVIQLPTDPINHIMDERSGMGKTGESYLVGKHEGVVSYRSDRTSEDAKIGQPHSTPYIEKALAGGKGHTISADHDGVLKLHSYLPLELPGLNWAVIGAIDYDEVNAPIEQIQYIVFLLASMLAALVIGAAFFFARTLSNPLQAMNEAAHRIAGGDWSTRVGVESGDELGQLAVSFNQMAANNQEQFWVKSNVAELTQIIQTSDSPDGFAGALIRKLAPLLGCGHGVFYILDEEKKCYRLLAGYGFKERKNLSNVFALGEGLVGQCALEKEPILLVGAPPDHIKITTGMGESSPLTIMAIPLVFQGKVLAVMELASFQPFTHGQKNLLEELIPALGLGLENLNRNQRTLLLLQQTQTQAEELESQSEEMRQANEELQARNEEVRRANEELEEQSLSLLKSQEELRAQQSALELANEDLTTARLEVERKAADLETASRYKSQFLANMSHELRTPLNSLLLLSKGFAENEDGNLTKEQVARASIIHGSGTDLLELINDILDLSKIEAGKMDLHITPVEVLDLAEDIRTKFKHMAIAKGLAWQVVLEEGTPDRVVTDAGKVRQIVKNFLSNAFKFTEKGSVSVSFGPLAEGGVVIAVADTGIGIARDKQELVFEAFQQADGSTSRKYGGTGLGLSIVRELAKLLGGKVRMTSEEGKGSTFSLLLPGQIAHDPHDADSFPMPPPPSPRPRRVLSSSSELFIKDDRDHILKGDRVLLVIEDDPTFATIVCQQARKRGYKCVATDTGENGLLLAIQYQPMGIILDRVLPDMDGQHLLLRLQQNPAIRRIPVHIISSMDRTLSLGKGAIGVLEKPVTMEQLREVMEKFECHARDGNSKILLVEDDANSSMATVRLLENDGVRVEAVASCRDALQRLREETFHCMILDLNLPGCGGFELLEQISRDPLIQTPPVVIYSGKDLSREEYFRLRHFTSTLVTKGTSDSGERLAREVGVFLQHMETSVPMPKTDEIPSNWKNVFQNTCVMLVDDDLRNTFALSHALEKSGIRVIMAPDGHTALDLLKNAPCIVNAVLMDVMMPVMDGHETTRRIRGMDNFRHLPIIGLSAKAMAEDRQNALEAGMNHFMPKPVDLEHLLVQLREHLFQKHQA